MTGKKTKHHPPHSSTLGSSSGQLHSNPSGPQPLCPLHRRPEQAAPRPPSWQNAAVPGDITPIVHHFSILQAFANHFRDVSRFLKLNGNDIHDQGQGAIKIIAMIRLWKKTSKFDILQVDAASNFEALGIHIIHSHWEPPVL